MVTGQNQVILQKSELDTENLQPDELLIESECTFISAGTELANYTGLDANVFLPGTWCSYPWKSGYANVGTVRATGSGVTRAAVGDRVFSYGNHASMVRYNQSRLLIRVPDELPSDLASASRMVGVAMTAGLIAEIGYDRWAAIFGLGSVGNLTAQVLQILGCRVIGVDPVPARRELAERCGIERTVGGDPQSVIEQIKAISGGEGAAITVDAVGDSRVIMQAMAATAMQGQVVILGTPRAPVEGNLTELLATIHTRRLTVHGAHEWRVPMYPAIGYDMSQFKKQEAVFDWMARGKIQLAPLISHRVAPEAIKSAYDGLLEQRESYTGVVLEWT